MVHRPTYKVQPDGSIDVYDSDPAKAVELSRLMKRASAAAPRKRGQSGPAADIDGVAGAAEEDEEGMVIHMQEHVDKLRALAALRMVERMRRVPSHEIAKAAHVSGTRGIGVIPRKIAPVLKDRGLEWQDIIQLDRGRDGSYWLAGPKIHEAVHALMALTGAKEGT